MALQIPMRVAPEVYAAMDVYRKGKQSRYNPRTMSDAARELIVKALQLEGLLPANDQNNDSAH